MFERFNNNPTGKNVGDCVIRAVSKATNQSWDETYSGICLQGYIMGDMPSANHVWGAYLKRKGFKRYMIPDNLPEVYTVADFTENHKTGTYILALSGHVVCVKDGVIYDSWDSGAEIPLYYWVKEEK